MFTYEKYAQAPQKWDSVKIVRSRYLPFISLPVIHPPFQSNNIEINIFPQTLSTWLAIASKSKWTSIPSHCRPYPRDEHEKKICGYYRQSDYKINETFVIPWNWSIRGKCTREDINRWIAIDKHSQREDGKGRPFRRVEEEEWLIDLAI